MTADVSTKPSEDVEIIENSPISILDDTIPLKLSSPSNNSSPVAVSKGNKRVALSHSVSFLNDSLSPHYCMTFLSTNVSLLNPNLLLQLHINLVNRQRRQPVSLKTNKFQAITHLLNHVYVDLSLYILLKKVLIITKVYSLLSLILL